MSTGRAIGHLAAVALRNVDWSLTPARATGPRRPVLDVLAPGIGAYRGEVVLTEKAEPADDPLLGLRAAEAAAMRDLVLTDSAAARLGKELPPMPVPWPAEGRALFTRLLGSGTGADRRLGEPRPVRRRRGDASGVEAGALPAAAVAGASLHRRPAPRADLRGAGADA